MRIELPYGKGLLPLDIPEGSAVDLFVPREAPPLEDPKAALMAAMDRPMDASPLEAVPTPASLAIAVPDETRPVPLKLLLPPLLDRCLAAWPTLSRERIAIVIGGGLHVPADEAQKARILPMDRLQGCRIVSHDARKGPFRDFGRTSRGTPVRINEVYGDAAYKIVLGMVDAHQFVGMTGGAKGVVVGCASADMITANHSMMKEPAAVAGNVATNPVRLDLDEAGERIGIDMAVNVVLDAAKRPVAILAGRPAATMREAANRTGELYGLAFERPYDIVVVSSGGHPKDICLYQAQKGLNPALQCSAPGGRILLVAECSQGIGDDVYHDYVRGFSDAAALMEAFKAGPFRMGEHKAYLFARTTTTRSVVLHTALKAEELASCLLVGGDAQTTLDGWLGENPQARIAVIRNGNSSFFRA
ncbi:MAG: nickel-dependent lactate racemase [Desulfovibrio sp.]|jgi:nickel-dependent lactate racemase|nr:nickel-dependent lactate racemase [Desulfovibrio sp.]